MIRRLKKDVLKELPDKRRQRIPIEVSEPGLQKEIRGKLQHLTDVLMGVESDQGNAVMKIFERMAKAKTPVIKEYLQDVVDRTDEKFIVFAHHKRVMDALSDALTK